MFINNQDAKYNNQNEMHNNQNETYNNQNETYNNQNETYNNQNETHNNQNETHNNQNITYNRQDSTYFNQYGFYCNNIYSNNNSQNFDCATYNNYNAANQVVSPIANTNNMQQGYFNDTIDQSFENNYYVNDYYTPANTLNNKYYNTNSTLNDGSFLNYTNNNSYNTNQTATYMNSSLDNVFIASASSSSASSLENSISISHSPKRVSNDYLSNKNTTRTATHHQLPEEAVDRLNDWFESHINHPYPTSEDKQRLAEDCGITSKQVNSWFCNRRNRSQNTKPKRIKRQLEKEISNVFNELVQNPNRTEKVIERIRSTLRMHDIGIDNYKV